MSRKRKTSPMTDRQRRDLRSRASREGVAIGGYHVLRLLDDFAAAHSERRRLRKLVERLVADEFREQLHDNYGGGYENDMESNAFHHGMDVVCNAIVHLWRAAHSPEGADGKGVG